MASERLRIWRPIMNRFGLDYQVIKRHPQRYSIEFAEKLNRCDEESQKLLLGIKEEV